MVLQELPECCQEAARTWKIRQLLNDLQDKYKLLNRGNKMGEFEMQYLCLLLSGIEPKDMPEKLYISLGSIRVKLSARNGLYNCIERLTGGQINNWRDPFILLVNKGYRKSEEAEQKENTVLIMTCDVEVSEQILRQLEGQVQQILGANKLRIQRIEQGSLVIFWQGSRSDCDRIEALFREGVLSDRLGVPVLDVEVVPNEEPINLTQWFESIFTSGWQRVEELLTPQQLRPAYFSNSVQRGKRIDLQIDLVAHAVNLLVSVSRESVEGAIVNLKVFPVADTPNLPPNLQLIILVEGEVFKEVTSRSADQYIQYEFEAEPGDEFAVKLVLGEAEITEDFVV